MYTYLINSFFFVLLAPVKSDLISTNCYNYCQRNLLKTPSLVSHMGRVSEFDAKSRHSNDRLTNNTKTLVCFFDSSFKPAVNVILPTNIL